MTERPHRLTIHLSDEELAFLRDSAARFNSILETAEPPNFPAPLGMTPERLVQMLIEKAHEQFTDSFSKTKT